MKINHSQILLTVLSTTIYLNLFSDGRSDNCKSNDKPGRCISIKNCPSIFNKFFCGPLNLDQIRNVQRLTCGFDGNDPKVCCPIQNISSPSLPDLVKYNSLLDLHPKLNLIPKLNDCGKTNVSLSDRIIGRSQAQHGSQPWIARLGYDVDKQRLGFYCGGSLISRRYVLTAAHCCAPVVGLEKDEDNTPVLVRLGEYNLDQDPDCSVETGKCSFKLDLDIEKIIIHPNYNAETKQNDIALIRLARDVSFETEFIRPICLPLEKELLTNISNFGMAGDETETWGYISGFGSTKWDVIGESTILQYVQLPVVTNSKCQSIYYQKTVITKTQMCAGGEAGKDSCDGDSGGAFMVFSESIKRFVQAGIVSFGPTRCASFGLPGIYTRLGLEHLTWILDNLEPS